MNKKETEADFASLSSTFRKFFLRGGRREGARRLFTNKHLMKNSTKILFVHIPKTAGISVYRSLADAVGADHAIRFSRNSEEERKKYLSMTETEIRSYNLLSGHFPLSFFLRQPIPDYKPVTVLRNPVDRELSAYFYIKTVPSHPRNTSSFRSLSLYQYLDRSEKSGRTNPQCMCVCGEKSFEKAKQVIDEQFFLAAPLEYIKDFSVVLGKQLGISVNQPAKVNKTAFRLTADEIHPDIIARFESLTREDKKLYRYVKEKFEKEFL
ncbi:MAG: hypothetical protein ACI9NT_000704 [Bacteroidia bacterium]|jgi:hypothetical protein